MVSQEQYIAEQVEQYHSLKQQQKEIEQTLQQLRSNIIHWCEQQETDECDIAGYRVKLVQQQRKEYDDNKMFEALPDPALWRMLSKVDGAKVTSLIKLNVISDEQIQSAYATKKTTLLHVTKQADSE